MLNSINFLLPIPSCSGYKIVTIWYDKRVLGIFLWLMRRNGYLAASGQKYDLAIRFGDHDFL